MGGTSGESLDPGPSPGLDGDKAGHLPQRRGTEVRPREPGGRLLFLFQYVLHYLSPSMVGSLTFLSDSVEGPYFHQQQW